MVIATSERLLVTVHNRDGQAATDRAELRAALLRTPREIPSRFFYDDLGSWLFERITELPEYYQTRTEHALLLAIAGRVAAASRASQLVEIGSGAATKTRVLLDALERTGCMRLYVPVDVAEGTVRRVAEELTAEYSELAVHGIVADFGGDLSPLPALNGVHSAHACIPGGRLVIFLGGTIGNLLPREAEDFLARRHGEMSPGDFFLLGVDLVKPVARVEAAYNDDAGITAEFNRNILRVANEVAGGGDFDPGAFTHRAFYDAGRRWIRPRAALRSRPRPPSLSGQPSRGHNSQRRPRAGQTRSEQRTAPPRSRMATRPSFCLCRPFTRIAVPGVSSARSASAACRQSR